MNYYSIILCFALSFLGKETKQFVEFKDANITVVKENGYATITLPFEVLKDYHIQSNSDISDGSIPTEIIFKEKKGYKIEHQKFSLKQDETIQLNGAYHKVISNQFEVTIKLKINKGSSNTKLEGELYYQACSNTQCLFPRSLKFQYKINNNN